MTPEFYYRRAMDEYDSVKATIGELSELAREIDHNFSYRKAMEEYDSILQSIMLTVAVADGVMSPFERQLIEMITEYTDLLVKLNRLAGTHLTWNDIGRLKGSDFDPVTKFLVKINDQVADDFVIPFALIDSVIAKSYLKEITSKTLSIVDCLAAIDGDRADSARRRAELTSAAKTMNRLIVSKWSDVYHRRARKKSR